MEEVRKRVYNCKECDKIFSSKSNLKRHNSNLHQTESESLKKEQVICHDCSQKFSNKSNLIRHLSRCKDGRKSKFEKLNCILCFNYEDLRINLLKHYKQFHGIDTSVKKLKFSSMMEFESWKENKEKQSISKYIRRQTRLSKGKSIHYYRCHRDGFYKTRGNNIRHFKFSGSNKINGCCPSKIEATVLNGSGVVHVDFVETHVGHGKELGRIPLKKSERNFIASKISQNISFDEIINELRDKMGEQSFERIHLLTRKDLYNIKMLYNLENDSIKCKNEPTLSSNILSSHVETTNSVIRYSKRLNELKQDNYSDLQINDFLVVIMNDAQLDVLKKYGNNCLCIDSISGVNPGDYELTTVMILDGLKQGFPCVFAFSNRSDLYIYKVIFDIIKNILGDNLIKPKYFMSDTSEEKYNAWCEVMGPVSSRLFSSWHVTRVWKENAVAKIGGVEKQSTIMKSLISLLEEPQKDRFQKQLKKVLSDLDFDYELNTFGFFFKNYFVTSQSCWAYCYRESGDMNMAFERMHKTLEYIYLKGKTAYQVDKAIDAIMKMVRGKLFERQVILHKGKIFSKLKSLNRNHKCASSIANASIVEEHKGIWMVYPVKGTGEPYKIETSYLDCKCELVCDECDACIHAYICSCPESSIKWNMCKHIHLLCIRLKNTEQQIPQSDIKNDKLNYEDAGHQIPQNNLKQNLLDYEDVNSAFEDNENEENDLLRLLSNANEITTSCDVDRYKARILEKINAIFNVVNTVDQCKVVDDALTPIIPIISAMQGQNIGQDIFN